MLFVSRKLRADSPLRRWADKRGMGVADRSLLRFEAVPFTGPTDADWWFFYSSRAVAFVDHIPTDVRTAAMGGGTARALLDRQHVVDFCGAGSPEAVAESFLAVSEGQRVFFPRARESRKSVQRALEARVEVVDAICYANFPAPPERAIEASVYIFTSPMNVAAYLDHFSLAPASRVLAIGPSTGGELNRRGVECSWPEVASEAGLVELLG